MAVKGPPLPGGVAPATPRVRRTPGHQVIGHSGRDGLALVGTLADPARPTQHPPEPSQVAHGARHPARRHGNAVVIQDHHGVLLSAHRSPDPLGHPVDPPPTGGPGRDPGKDVSGNRLVEEHRAGDLGAGLESEDRLVDSVRSVPILWHGSERHGHRIAVDVRPVVRVVLHEPDAVCHVQEVADGGWRVGRVGQFWHVIDHRVVETHRPILDGKQGQNPGDRLGHGKHAVAGRATHSVEVALVYHPSPVQHQEGVGVGAVEHLVERPGAPTPVVDCQAV